VLTIAGKVLAMALGVGVAGIWWAVALAEAVLGVATIVLLVRRAKDPAERLGVERLDRGRGRNRGRRARGRNWPGRVRLRDGALVALLIF